MRFVVVGAGAIGAYVGASLARGGVDVVLVARGAHLEAMQQRGVRVVSPRGDFEVHPVATDELSVVADADVVFLGLKAHSIPGLAPQLGKLLRPDTTLISAQNGIPWWYFQSEGGPLDGLTLESVDPGGIVTNSIPHEAIVGCVVFASTEIAEPGVIRHVEGTRFSLGEPSRETSPRCERISAAFKAGGLKAPIDRNLRDEIWLKLLGNATFNPISVLTGSTLGELGESPAMLELLTAAFEEIASVARRLGIEFRVPLERRLEAGIEVGDHKTSMLQDYEAGKRLEHACLTGAIIELAGQLDVPVPHVQTLHACIDHVDRLLAESASAGKRDSFRDRADKSTDLQSA
jgi:2-dehydropantoate 2-reductase